MSVHACEPVKPERRVRLVATIPGRAINHSSEPGSCTSARQWCSSRTSDAKLDLGNGRQQPTKANDERHCHQVEAEVVLLAKAWPNLSTVALHGLTEAYYNVWSYASSLRYGADATRWPHDCITGRPKMHDMAQVAHLQSLIAHGRQEGDGGGKLLLHLLCRRSTLTLIVTAAHGMWTAPLSWL